MASTDSLPHSSRRAVAVAPVDPPESDEPGVIAPAIDWTDMRESDHFVQFYETDDFLQDSVAGFIGSGLGRGDAALIIAEGSHRAGIKARLAADGLNPAALEASGRLLMLDAARTLAGFMVDGMPDAARFEATVGHTVERTAQIAGRLRAFGEMVALLWREGNQAGALRLEELWNELGARRQFALFCAYPLREFSGEGSHQPFFHVCNAHSRVIPAESYAAQASTDARLRCITALQQKACTVDEEIAGRKRAEEAAREEQRKLAMAVGAAKLGIWELDTETGLIAASEQCRQHFRLPADAPFTYRRFLELLHPDDRGGVEQGLREALAQRAGYALEFRVKGPTGQPHWIALSGRPFAERTPRLVGITLDVTAQRSVTETLERIVADRTTALRETVAELEAFGYSLSHDMRTPLRSVRSYAEIMLQECGDSLSTHGRHYLDRIITSAAQMDRLIQDILAFSRLSRAEFVPEPVDLERLVRGTVDSTASARPEGTQITIEGRLPCVMGNTAAITQCLSNLLDNAVKFVAPGVVPCIALWAEELVDGGRRVVRLSVRDNGIGIPHHAQSAIFLIFQRLNKNYEGSGIGLCIVQKAITRMGGRVGVASEPGRGSVFWMELPQAPAAINGHSAAKPQSDDDRQARGA